MNFPLIIADTSFVAKLGFKIIKSFPMLLADVSKVTALSFRVNQRFAIVIASASFVKLAFRLFIEQIGSPDLLWVGAIGWQAMPYSNWIYVVSRPLVSPGSVTPYRAYKYDGTLPYGYQQRVELGLFDNPLNAQNACQADFDAISAPVLVIPS